MSEFTNYLRVLGSGSISDTSGPIVTATSYKEDVGQPTYPLRAGHVNDGSLFLTMSATATAADKGMGRIELLDKNGEVAASSQFQLKVGAGRQINLSVATGANPSHDGIQGIDPNEANPNGLSTAEMVNWTIAPDRFSTGTIVLTLSGAKLGRHLESQIWTALPTVDGLSGFPMDIYFLNPQFPLVGDVSGNGHTVVSLPFAVVAKPPVE